MKHARMTHDQLGAIRGNAPRQVAFPKQPGASRPVLGAKLIAYAPRIIDRKTGVVERERESVECVITIVEDEHDQWVVTYRCGGVDTRRLLRATPGAMKTTRHPDGSITTDGDGDYTTSLAAAAHGEPECVPESYQQQLDKDARSTEEIRAAWERGQELRDLSALIARVEQRAADADRAYLQKLRAARRQLQKKAA